MILRLLLIIFFTTLSIFTLLGQQNSFKRSVYFDYGKSAIRTSEHATLLETIDTLTDLAQYSVKLYGNTDADGSNAYNQKLSENRTHAIQQFLIEHGALKERISTASVGETSPIADNVSETGKQRNRRVDIIVLYQKNLPPSPQESSWAVSVSPPSINIPLPISTNNKGEMPATELSPLDHLYATIADKPTETLVKVSKTEVTKVVGQKGTILLLPPDAFGLPESSEVLFTLREAYSISDMLAENLTTQAGDNILASGGMVKIDAVFNRQSIQPSKPLMLMMPKSKMPEPMQDSMRLFTGTTMANNTINWALPSNGGVQFNNFNIIRGLSEKMKSIKQLNRLYQFSTDTCGCSKMYVWKVSSNYWKRQKDNFKNKKITVLPPRYLYSDIKPAYYDFYKINNKRAKTLNNCGDTLSLFCKMVAMSNTPKSWNWEKKHRYSALKKLKYKKTYPNEIYYTTTYDYYNRYKVKTYARFLDTLKKELLKINLELEAEGFDKATLEKMNDSNFKTEFKKIQAEYLENRNKRINEVMNGSRQANAQDIQVAANYYLYETSNLGWVNCDYFMNTEPRLLVDVKTDYSFDPSTNAKLIFKKQKVIFPSNEYANKIIFNKVRKQEEATIVAIKVEKDVAYLALQSITTDKNKIFKLDFEALTPDKLKEKLKTLD